MGPQWSRPHMINYTWLVVEPTPLKNMKVNGKDDIPYMKWKIKAMFETTNQIHIMESAYHLY